MATTKRPINVPLQRGALEGYQLSDLARDRRKHLMNMIKKGHATYSDVIKRLNILSIYNKNKAPQLSEILKRDIAYLQRHVTPLSPLRQMSPQRQMSVQRKLSLIRKMSPPKMSSPRRKMSPPRRKMSPRSKMSPPKMSSLRRKMSPPRRKISPRRKMSPPKMSSPRRKMSPRKMSSPRRKMSPRSKMSPPRRKMSPRSKMSPRKTSSPRQYDSDVCIRNKISQVMSEFKQKKLRTPNEKVVKNRKQAIAIALSVADKTCN